MLKVQARHRLGHLSLDVDIRSDGGVTALFGPSGAGKTSVIRIIAGLLRPDEGLVQIDEDVYLDTQHRRFTPVHRRRLGYVFQEPRLFPHFDVRHNLLYGRRFSRSDASDPGAFDRIVDLLGLGPLLARRGAALSGGERQRVAIGRALLAAPRLLLMDEPLAALDEARKAEILPYLDRLCSQSRLPIVYVSHSVAEVARLAHRVVLMREGRVERQGSPSDIFSRAAAWPSRREAGVLLDGIVMEADAAKGLARLLFRGFSMHVPVEGLEPGQPTRLHIAARDVMIAVDEPSGLSALNVLRGDIEEIMPAEPHMVDVVIHCGGETILSRITALSAERLALGPGRPVFAIVKTAALDS